jgi:hypothetical protein
LFLPAIVVNERGGVCDLCKKGKVALVARWQHSKDGEWGNGVVFSVAALGLVVLASLHYVFSNRLDEGAWDRLATSAASITPAIASAHANPIKGDPL